MKAETGLDSWQKYLIGKMIDAYERTGTYRGEAKCNQNIRIPVTDIFPAYEQDSVNLQELQGFEVSMRKLEQLTPIRIQYKDKRIKDEFCAFRIAAAAVEPALYELAGRKPRRELHAGQVDLYERYQRKDSVLDAYVRDQEALLHADKNAWFEPDVAENVMQTVDAIVNNRGNILCRELSISLFGDTKYIEKHGVLSKALRVLKQYGSFDFAETDFNSKKEYEEAILAEYEVYENPAYINFNGDGELVFRNGARLELKAGTPIAVRSDCLSDIVTIRSDLLQPTADRCIPAVSCRLPQSCPPEIFDADTQPKPGRTPMASFWRPGSGWVLYSGEPEKQDRNRLQGLPDGSDLSGEVPCLYEEIECE